MVRIVIDTGVFYKPEALDKLRAAPETVVVPAVAFAERVRQLRRDGRSVETFIAGLERSRFVPEPLDPHAAARIAARLTDDAKWGRLSRDALIAAHVREGDQLWTTNARDFRELGVPDAQIVAIPF